MGWLRFFGGYVLALRQHELFQELEKEYPEFHRARYKALIPDPRNDYPRMDTKNRSWKRFRDIQYKIPQVRLAKARVRVKIVYHSPRDVPCPRLSIGVRRRRDHRRRFRVRVTYRLLDDLDMSPAIWSRLQPSGSTTWKFSDE